jgi:Zn-dependent metalloprotease
MHIPPRTILPPHLLRAVARHGNEEQRAFALETLSMDSTFRTVRAEQLPTVQLFIRQPAATLPPGEQRREIYTAGNTQNLPGKPVRFEGEAAVGNVAANEAYDGLGATYDFYWRVLRRHSLDDRGLPLEATVNFGQRYDNAFWNGNQMVFGDGDGDLFNRFTVALDVIGHELTHGVTELEAALSYSYESGALNESLSDVFGSLVKQYKLGQTAAQADWLIGVGLFTAKVQGKALRSMRAPGTAYDDPVLGKDPQPANYRDFVRTQADNGGVHINSGIPNRAFYLVATALGGNAWDEAGRIWYETLRDRDLRPTANFLQFAQLTARNAARLYTPDSPQVRAVNAAWTEVGVLGDDR